MDRVRYYFEEISKIPRRSGNTKAVSDYCVNFAKMHNLQYYQDELNNVIIYKPGDEAKEPIILQGHLDMVCEKDTAIETIEEGGFLRANGTTLGADDGVAVAMCLALLEDEELACPPLEVVFTTDEETGMFGAIGLDCSQLSGKRLLNIDSEEEGVLTVGCAGGERAEITLPVTRELVSGNCFKITVTGLLGGHSGVEIGKGRINAVILLARFLQYLLDNDIDLRLCDIKGGTADNVIPNTASAVILSSSIPENLVNEFVDSNKIETDKNLEIIVEQVENSSSIVETTKVIKLLNSIPNGVQNMRGEDVVTSLNLGQIKTLENAVVTRHSLRSNIKLEKQKLEEIVTSISESFGASITTDGHYPAWEYLENSNFRDKVIECYKNCYNLDPEVVTIHAGLECGIFSEKIPGLEAVSIGPTIYDIHTTSERLDLASCERTYNFVRNILENL